MINELVKPASVIASHANEAATENGKVRAGSKTEAFTRASKVPVHVPLSGKTMEFNAGQVHGGLLTSSRRAPFNAGRVPAGHCVSCGRTRASRG